jgi:hypothetical protein
MIRVLRKMIRKLIVKLVPDISKLTNKAYNFDYLMFLVQNTEI